MNDYIDKDAALEVLNKLARSNFTLKPGYEYYLGALNDVGQDIKYLPSADVKPVVHGKWTIEQMNTYELSYGTTAYEPVYRCSACKMLTESYLRLDEPIMPEDADFPKFCPNCGADMRGNDND